MQTFSAFLICLSLDRLGDAEVTNNSKVLAALDMKINVLCMSILLISIVSVLHPLGGRLISQVLLGATAEKADI